MKKAFANFLISVFILLSQSAFGHELRLETGGSRVLKNDFQVPQDNSGTRIELPQGDREFFYRLQGTYNFDSHHSLRVLYAPFQLKTDLTSSDPILFNGASFQAGVPLDVDYKFNSYRLSYIYTFSPEETFRPHLGFTGKIRDAHIKLSNGTSRSSRANVGFVPLLNVGFDWDFSERWQLIFDLDGLAASQGRAFDGKIELDYMINAACAVGIGYRVLDGGVDSEENYNFSLIDFAFLSVSLKP